MSKQTADKETLAAVLARVSTAEQATSGLSLDEQLERCKAYAKSQGLTVVAEYVDEGQSGDKSLEERKAGAQLLADARAGKFGRLIVAKLDRFTRNVAKGAADIQKLEEAGVALAFLDLSMDTSTGPGRLMLNVLMAVADFERDRILERTLGAKHQAAQMGRYVGGRLPHGYVTDDHGRIQVDEQEADTIRLAFTLRAEGKSLDEIAKRLNDAGHKPRPQQDSQATATARRAEPDAKPVVVQSNWTKATLGETFQKTIYMGTGYERAIDDGEPYTFDAPPIVAPSVWQAANAVTFNLPRNVGQRQHVYGLSQRIEHLHRNGERSGMFGTARKRKDGTWKRDYRCTASRPGSDGSPAWCSDAGGLGEAFGHTITAVEADKVEGLALLYLLDILKNEEKYERLVRHADQALADQGMTQETAEEWQAVAERLRRKMDFYRDQAADVAAERGSEAAAEWLKLRTSELEGQIAAAEDAAARALDAETWRQGLKGGIQALLTMEIADEGDASAGEDDPSQERGSAKWWSDLEEQARGAITPRNQWGHTHPLSEWAMGELERLATLLQLRVTVTEREGWEDDIPQDSIKAAWAVFPPALLPVVDVELAPGVGLNSRQVSPG